MHSFSFEKIPKKISRPLFKWLFLCGVAILLELIGAYLALFWVGADTDQGNIYRILFIHVPVAWCAFFWIFFSAISAVGVLFSKNQASKWDKSMQAAIELGVLFSFLVLLTGSLWGRPTWGVWWDWDPRLTSSLVMFLVGCACLLLRHFTPDIRSKSTMGALVALANALNVPVVYFSVTIWRSLHQPQTFAQRTNNVSSDIFGVLLFNFVSLFFLSVVLYNLRKLSLAVQESLEKARGAF